MSIFTSFTGPRRKRDRYVDSWKAFVRLKEEGKAKSIGVSNFGGEQLKRNHRRNRRHARPQSGRAASGFSATRPA